MMRKRSQLLLLRPPWTLLVATRSWLFGAIKEFAVRDVTVLLIRGNPEHADFPATPIDGRSSLGKETCVREFVQSGIGALMGAKHGTYPWKGNYSHPLFHEVSNKGREAAATTAALSNGKTLPYYLDDIQSVTEYLILGCIREGDDTHQVTKVLDNSDGSY